MRSFTNADLWSAIRGCGMYRMDNGELKALRQTHLGNATTMFASAVIAEAARQVLVMRSTGTSLTLGAPAEADKVETLNADALRILEGS